MIRAVIVGINDYPQAPLLGCINDADDVIAHIKNVVGITEDQIHPLYDSRATKDAIVGALRNMIDGSKPGDHLLFHYSGHGTQIASQSSEEPDGLDECLCPVNFDWADPSTALRDDELAAIFATVPAGTSLTAVLDSCHSGDMQRLALAKKSGARFMPWPTDVAMRLRKRKRAVRKRSVANTRTVVVSACKSDESAADTSFDNRPNGAFTYHWLATLRSHRSAGLTAVIAKVTAALEDFDMHPELDGPASLQRAAFLAAPAAESLPEISAQAPAQVLFDESWTTKVFGMDYCVKLCISMLDGVFEFQLTSNTATPLRWSFVVDGDTRREVSVGYGVRLEMTVDQWRATPTTLAFDLGVQVMPPFTAQIAVAQQRVTLQIASVSRSLPAPTSAADLHALIQLAQLGVPKEPRKPGTVVHPRDGDEQWTGFAAVIPFGGGLFGTRFDTNAYAYVPPGFVRDHIEVSLDPPNSGNVYFIQWEDSDEHIGKFRYHVGCSAFGGGIAFFSMHCRRDPNYVRQLPTAAAEPSKPNGNGHHGASARQPAEHVETKP